MIYRQPLIFNIECTGLHQNTTPVSIGAVCGQYAFYGVFFSYDEDQVDEWLRKNVINNLNLTKEFEKDLKKRYKLTCTHMDPASTVKEFKEWITTVTNKYGKLEVWSNRVAYNWVLFCEMWDGITGIPEDIYYTPYDISSYMRLLDIDPDTSLEAFAQVADKTDAFKHNALWDAIVIKGCKDRLDQIHGKGQKAALGIDINRYPDTETAFQAWKDKHQRLRDEEARIRFERARLNERVLEYLRHGENVDEHLRDYRNVWITTTAEQTDKDLEGETE